MKTLGPFASFPRSPVGMPLQPLRGLGAPGASEGSGMVQTRKAEAAEPGLRLWQLDGIGIQAKQPSAWLDCGEQGADITAVTYRAIDGDFPRPRHEHAISSRSRHASELGGIQRARGACLSAFRPVIMTG